MTNANGSASGTTHSAVADGSIVVRDQGNQKQDLNDLSRDTENANGRIDKIFDKEKIEQNQALAQAISEVGVQTMQNVGQQMQINALQDALSRLSKTDDYQKATPESQQAMLNNDPQYLAAQKEYGIGSPFWTAGTAISAALAGLAGGDMNQALAGGLAPYLSLAVKKVTTDKAGNVNDAENIAGHALAGAVIAYLQGGSVGGGAAGAASGELAAKATMEAYYPGRTVESLTNAEKSNISAISTLAAGLAGGVVGNTSLAGVQGAVAGKVAVENNALSAPDEKQRQDAKWSLPYLEGDKKVQAEKLVTDLDAKDKAFDAAIDAACKNLSSEQCSGMRQELAAMGKSYEEKLDGQYIGTMASVYLEGAGKVDSLLWQYATADAQAQKAKDIQTIASNWGVSIETASTLYTGMAITHTTAAIGGAVYGMKGESVPVAKGSTTETYFRVEGGGSGTKTSQNRISANPDGSITINSGCSGQLCVSTNGSNHASYYLTNKRADGSVVVFEVDAALHKQIMDAAVPQKPIPGVPKDPKAPKIVDPNKGEPSVSLELPKVWDRLIEQNSSKARVLTKEEFMNEFGK